MSFVVSAPDAAGTPFQVVQRTSFGPRRPAIRSRCSAPVGPPPIVLTGASTLQLATTLATGSQWPTYTNADGTIVGVFIEEKARSRSTKATTDGRTLTRLFLIHGCSDPAKVTDIGPQVGDQDTEYAEYFVEERSGAPYATGGGEADIVLLTIGYVRLGNDPRGSGGAEGTLTFEFGSESEHIDRAIAQVHYGGDADRVGDLINVTDDEVQGLDINAPIIDFQEEHSFSIGQFSPAFRRLLATTVQTTNAAAFREWLVGEVLFVGASARKAAGRWYVTFSFRVRRNVDSIIIPVYTKAGELDTQDVLKRGWQYLWIESIRLPAAGASPTSTRVVPHAVHVATVYDEIDFSVFGIGTNPLP